MSSENSVAKAAPEARTYSNANKYALHKLIIASDILQNRRVHRQVHQNREGILGDRRVVFDEELQVSDRLQVVCLEQHWLRMRISYQVLDGCS